MTKQEYDTIEEAGEAMSMEINDLTTPFLQSFVKKSSAPPSPSAKKKSLFEEVEAMGVKGLDIDKETMDSLKVRGCQFLFAEGRTDEMDEYAGKFNLVVDHETGAVLRAKSHPESVGKRYAGSK